jgi:benzoate-CoA ligase
MNAADDVLSPERVAAHPERTAVLFHEERLTYAALLALVNRYANGLRAFGIEREQRVMLMLKDSPHLAALLLAVMKIGAVVVPINLRASSADLALMLNDSRAKLFCVEADFLPVYQAAAPGVMHAHRVLVANADAPGTARVESLAAGQSAAAHAEAVSPDDMAFWLYTSGTTGTPKAAVHLHHDVGIAHRFPGETLGVGPGDRIFATSKLFFAYALGNNLLPALKLGATSILFNGWPDSESIAAILDRHRPTVLLSVPTMFRNMLRDGVATRERFAGVRHCVSAGERLPIVLFDRWKEATGHEIIDGIGTTETVYFFLSNRPGEVRAGASGKPTPGAEVELRDNGGNVVRGADVSGVLWVKMPSVADRYWNQQERSNAAFFGPWFRTGDVYVRDRDGYYFHEGRADDMLKISGQWVSPAEIEEHVLKLPQVADAAVVGATNVDGLTRLALFIVPQDRAADRDALAAGIQAALTASLSVYKCPREIRLVEDIPRTATGKVQRYKLRASIDAGVR